ncbi:hypothetical protein P9112_014694 [Eukaryota sp. TZLM1-RC]
MLSRPPRPTDFLSPFGHSDVRKPSQEPHQTDMQSSTQPEQEPLKHRFTLSEFDFHRIVGTGTFGSVYLALHKKSQQWCAVKVLNKMHIVQLKQTVHIMNERDILTKIQHPFIVNLLGTANSARDIYIIMEFVNGGELFTYLRRKRRFSVETARFYAAQIVLALEHLHSKNIVYRDLKPENLLLDSKGNLKICDFGFAKIVEDRTFTICGTPEYLAPEVIQNRGHGKGVDWWALGILLYEMMAGYAPFSSENPYKTYKMILNNPLQFPSHFDAITRDLIQRLLVHDRFRRLGCFRGGAADVKRHKFFREIDWGSLIRREVTAPIRPKPKHAGDPSLFEIYPADSSHNKEPTPEVLKIFEEW